MRERVKALVSSKLEEEEWQDCFFIDIDQNNKKVIVYLDCDTGMTFDRCKKMSRYLEAIIDEEGWMGEKYVLEVSSPGVDRPLKMLRQYKRHIGRQLEVTYENEGDYNSIVGKLEEANENSVSLSLKGTKKNPTPENVVIPMNKIKKAIVQISFK